MTFEVYDYTAQAQDPGFTKFMIQVEQYCEKKTGLSVFDFADFDWWSAYEDKVSASVAVNQMMMDEGYYADA